jgi:cytochrome bd-type quinol oxidase subunit 2
MILPDMPKLVPKNKFTIWDSITAAAAFREMRTRARLLLPIVVNNKDIVHLC